MKNQNQVHIVVLVLAGILMGFGSCRTNNAKRHSIDPKNVENIVLKGPHLAGECKLDDMTFNNGDKYCLIGEGQTDGECFICQDGTFSNTHEACSETKSCSTPKRP